jgi:MYXO-CTERM domain-containing protein
MSNALRLLALGAALTFGHGALAQGTAGTADPTYQTEGGQDDGFDYGWLGLLGLAGLAGLRKRPEHHDAHRTGGNR